MKKSSNVEKIQSARSLNEVLSIVDILKKKISNIGKSTPKLIQALSSANTIDIPLSSTSEELELADIKRKNTKSKKGSKSLRTVLDKNFKAPSQKEMVNNSSAIEELTIAISELEVAVRVLSSKTFSKFDDSKDAIRSIKSIIKQANDLKKTQLDALNKVSKKHIPKQHKSIIDAAIKTIKRDVNLESYSGIATRSFILNPAKDTIYFQTFILIKNLANEEGFIYEAYSFVITNVLDTSVGEAELVPHLTCLKDPKIPGSFPIGSEVQSVSALALKMNSFNLLNNIDIKKSRYKLNKDTDDLRNPIKNLNRHIKGIRVKDKQLFVKISTGLSESQTKSLRETLIAYVRSIFLPRSRNKSVVWKEVRGKASGSRFLVFAISDSNLNPKEFIRGVNDLAQKLNLNPRLTQDIVQNLVGQL